MGAEAAALVRTFPVGKRMVTLVAQAPCLGRCTNITFDWHPTVPERLTQRELRQYRTGRDAALGELGECLGGSVLVVEV